MKNKKLQIAILILAISTLPIALIIFILQNGLLGQGDAIHFHSNYQDALAEAKSTNKPMFVEFRCDP